ncbi:MAG: 4-hydroxybenzoate octaprenyltransferase, partial [Alphaproteobacteria bacterium]|nr:4-hydroxybenzoate octaprenyltransferase [Alphaproteobacteria bacterium]
MNSINSKANRLSQNPWVAFLPEQFQPYAYLGRFDKPIGVWLLLAPCLWSITLASYPGLPDGEILLLFFMGAFLMRAAGCAYNDLLDKTYDAQVQRTYTRPIASGQLLERQGMLFLAFLLSVSLLILVQFNFFSIALGFTALVFVMLYPLMKRITYWPQAFLGLTFNWGALLGWAVIREELSWVSILLYLAGIFWTL